MKIYAIPQEQLEDAWFRYTHKSSIIPDAFATAFGCGWMFARGLDLDKNSFQFFKGVIADELDIEC